MGKILLAIKGVFIIPGFVSFLGVASLVAIILAILFIALGRKALDKLWAKIAILAVALVGAPLFLIYMYKFLYFLIMFRAGFPDNPTISMALAYVLFIILVSFPFLFLFIWPIFSFLLLEYQGRCMYERGMRFVEEGKKDEAIKIITDYEKEVAKSSAFDKWLALPTWLRVLKNKLQMSV